MEGNKKKKKKTLTVLDFVEDFDLGRGSDWAACAVIPSPDFLLFNGLSNETLFGFRENSFSLNFPKLNLESLNPNSVLGFVA